MIRALKRVFKFRSKPKEYYITNIAFGLYQVGQGGHCYLPQCSNITSPKRFLASLET